MLEFAGEGMREAKIMGKNVYVTPRNRDKWSSTTGGQEKKAPMGDKQQEKAQRARQLAEKYKQQKRAAQDE